MKKYFIFVFISWWLIGCTKSSGIMTIGPEKYMVSVDVDSSFYDPSDTLQKAIEEANLYCNSLGKIISVQNISNGNAYGVLNGTVMFECVDKK